MPPSNQETEEQIKERIENLKVRASRSKKILGAVSIVMFLVSTIGLILMCLAANGCYDERCSATMIKRQNKDKCTSNKTLSVCRYTVSETCNAIVPVDLKIDEENPMYKKKPDEQDGVRNEYHVRCADTIARNKYKDILTDAPKESPPECQNLVQIWMCFFYPRFWFAACFASALIGLVIGSLVNTILVFRDRTGSSPLCSIVLGILMVVVTVIHLVGILTFSESLNECFSTPVTWIAALFMGIILALASFTEGAVAHYMDKQEFEIINARRKMKGRPAREKLQYDICGRKRYDSEASLRRVVRSEPQLVDNYHGTNDYDTNHGNSNQPYQQIDQHQADSKGNKIDRSKSE